MDLYEYHVRVAELPRPNDAQMYSFARFVARAHSWYEHLPLAPPGVSFRFFLDPTAGMQREADRQGRVFVTPRADRRFHYSSIATGHYRERFGHLAFAGSRGLPVSGSEQGRTLLPSDDQPAIYNAEEQRLEPAPREVLLAGRAKASGIIHTLAAQRPEKWLALASEGRFESWPEESGGQAGLEKILDRCRELSQGAPMQVSEGAPHDQLDDSVGSVDLLLHQLLEPERERQLRGMVAAMQRLCDLVLKN